MDRGVNVSAISFAHMNFYVLCYMYPALFASLISLMAQHSIVLKVVEDSVSPCLTPYLILWNCNLVFGIIFLIRLLVNTLLQFVYLAGLNQYCIHNNSLWTVCGKKSVLLLPFRDKSAIIFRNFMLVFSHVLLYMFILVFLPWFCYRICNIAYR